MPGPGPGRRGDRTLRIVVVLIAVVVVLGVAGVFGWQTFFADRGTSAAGSSDSAADSTDSDASSGGDSDGEAGGEGDRDAGGERSEGAEGGRAPCPTEPAADAPKGVTCGYGEVETPGMGNGIGTGDPNAPVVVELFEDFLCPHCANFEADTAAALANLVESGDIRVVRYPMTLTAFGRPTELAAQAYACAADAGAADEFAGELFANSGTVWDTETLLQAGVRVGLSDDPDFITCVTAERFRDWVASIDDEAASRGVMGTPTVFVNGEEVALSDTPLTELEAAIRAALDEN